MRAALRLLAGLALSAGFSGTAAPHTRVELVLSHTQARPGDTVEVGVLLTMESGWHTYWVNPGDGGGATEIRWGLPAGMSVGTLRWPVPERYDLSGIVTYVYHDTVLLAAPLKISTEHPFGPAELRAEVSWLECDELCLPGDAELSGRLEIGAEAVLAPGAGLFERWQAAVPREESVPGLRAYWRGPSEAERRALVLEWSGSGVGAEFFPFAASGYEVLGEANPVETVESRARLVKTVVRRGDDWPSGVAGVLVTQPAPDLRAYSVSLRPQPGGGGEDSRAVALLPGGEGGLGGRSVWLMLVFAFVGGVILNLMPCVLPVVALKVLSFVRQAELSRATVRRQGVFYGVGVLVSFLVLAFAVIAVQWGGRLASWGMQFQSPEFLLAMTTLVVLVALNLFGVYEVALGGRAMGTVSGLASREGDSGAFFNGVLATALATPCTAPFLGTAVGFAFAQPPGGVLVMFLVIGLGLAAPYVAISFLPGLARWLPKPGPWMERFKVAMGFPMLGAGVWLLSLLSRHYGAGGVLWVGVFLILVALASWVWGQFAQRGIGPRGAAAAVSLGLLVVGYAGILEGQLQWRRPRLSDPTTEGPVGGAAGLPWQRWSPEAVQAARSAGRPVLVDFTADWCVTCQANKKTSLEISSVREKVAATGTEVFLGDYTLRDDAITAELLRYGRAGVPLVLVYPRGETAPPEVLPELLTPSTVLEALDRAAR